MAFTDLGSIGAVGNSNNNQTGVVLTTTASVAVGDLVVVVVAVDNPQNGGDAGVTVVGNSGVNNTWVKAIQICNALAAQGGASVSIWYTHVTNAMAIGTTIQANFTSTSASDASAIIAKKFSVGAGKTVVVEGVGTLVSNTAADPGALDVTTADIECLRVRGIAAQVGNNTSLTTTAGWTAWANGNSATSGTTGEMCARAESRIITGTGASSNPTYVSAIYASAYVAFKEAVLPITGTGTLVAVAPTRTNHATRSEEFDTAGWNKLNLSVVPNTEGTAETIADNATNGLHYFYHNGFIPTDGPVTLSIDAKAGTHTWIQISCGVLASNYANFDVASGTTGNKGAGVTSSIETLGNGWYRCIMSVNTTGSTYLILDLIPSNIATNAQGHVGTGTTVLVNRAQHELNAVATAYIKTTTAAVSVPISIVGVGTAIIPPVTGTGTLAAQNAAAAFFGKSESVGSGGGALPIIVDGSGPYPRFGNTINTMVSQVFIATGDVVTSIKLRVMKITDDVVDAIALWLNTNDVEDTLLGEAFYSAALITEIETPTDVTIVFPTPVPVIRGASYYFSVGRTGAQAVDYYYSIASTDDVYAGGEAWLHNGTNWVIQPAADFVFTVNQHAAGGVAASPSVLSGVGTVSWSGTGALVPRGLSITNVFVRSEEFGVTSTWLANECPVTSNVIAAPDGTMTADRASDNTVNAFHYVGQNNPNYNGTPVTFSVYVKAGTITKCQIYCSLTTAVWINYDLAAGSTLSKSAGITGGIFPVGDGWFRIWATVPVVSGSRSFNLMLKKTDSAPAQYIGAGEYLYLWGGQSEHNATPNQYVKTTTIGVTVSFLSSILVGAGYAFSPPVTGTGTLAAGPADLDAFGDARSTGTAALVTSAAAASGAGISQIITAAALGASSATLSSAGVSSSRSTSAALAAQSNFLQLGAGLSSSVGTAALLPATSVMVGAGSAALPTGEGVLVAGAAALAGAGQAIFPPVFGTGTLVTTGVSVTGTGLSQSLGAVGLSASASAVTGAGLSQVAASGALVSFAALSGAGISRSFGTATLASQGDLLLGFGASRSVGTAPLSANVAAIVGAGLGPSWVGTAALASQVSAVAGSGVAHWVGLGVLPPGLSAVVGTGKTSWTMSGAMPAQLAALAGAGASYSFGTAALACSASVVDADGFAVTGIGGSGQLVTFAALSGTGVSHSVGPPAALVSPGALAVAGGTSESRGTGVMPSAPSALSAFGLGSSVGTAALTAQAATVVGAGVSRWVATGALPAGTASVVSSGSVRWTVSGQLSASVSVLAAAGVSSSRVTTAALQATVANIVGAEGAVVISGTGTLPSQSAQVTGVGRSIATGTGALVLPSALLAGAGLSRSQGAAPLLSQASVINALGQVKAEGLGVLTATASDVDGVGGVAAAPTGTGALAAQASSVVGAGVVIAMATGTGALAAQAATLAGAGVRQWIATGQVSARVATLAGAGKAEWIGVGALSAQVSTATGAGFRGWAATGALPSPAAALGGVGLSTSSATASLQAARSAIMGFEGVVIIGGAGYLQAQSRWVYSVGAVSGSRGTGALVTGRAIADAVGTSGARGAAALTVGRSDLDGTGLGQAQGAGALACSGAALAAPGIAEWISGGALAATGPSVAGVSVSGSRGAGALAVTDRAKAEGEGASGTIGHGMLVANPATVSGLAFSLSFGAGELAARDHTLAGAGAQIATGWGVLRHTTRAEVEGEGVTGSVGFGEVTSRRALMLGFSTSVAYAHGALVASSAALSGTEQAVTSGDGEIIAGAAEIVGTGTAGDTTWLLTEATPLPGSYPGTAMYTPGWIAAAPAGGAAAPMTGGVAAAPMGGAAAPVTPPPPWWLGKAA